MNFCWPAAAGTVAGAVLWGGLLALGAAPAPALQPIAPGQSSGAPHVTRFAPLAYFNANCARCHGPYGALYGADFGKMDDKTLHGTVDEMAQGPAQAPLAAGDLNVLVAWHRALRDEKPFVAIVKAEPKAGGWKLAGEISPGASLQINGAPVEVKDAQWEQSVAAGALKLRAQKGAAVTQLDANAAAFAP